MKHKTQSNSKQLAFVSLLSFVPNGQSRLPWNTGLLLNFKNQLVFNMNRCNMTVQTLKCAIVVHIDQNYKCSNTMQTTYKGSVCLIYLIKSTQNIHIIKMTTGTNTTPLQLLTEGSTCNFQFRSLLVSSQRNILGWLGSQTVLLRAQTKWLRSRKQIQFPNLLCFLFYFLIH